MSRVCAAVIALLVFAPVPARAGEAKVLLSKTPDGGIQPQAIMDDQGALHVLYYKGDPGHGDLYYVRRAPGKHSFLNSIRVNSQGGSAVAAGSIRGGQLAVGKNNRAHVAWNGSGQARPQNPQKGHPMLYTRLNDAGAGFEEQRNLMRDSDVLDGGGTVAADRHGNVYVAWHALPAGGASGEEGRHVWLTRSSDEGKTFGREEKANTKSLGACGCCGMKAFADTDGRLHMVYRTAEKLVSRDMFLLVSKDQGKSFLGNRLHKWEVENCPMSSEAFAEGPAGVYAAWDTDGQIYFARVKKGSADFDEPASAPGPAKGRRHPALAVNRQGEMILVWTEGTGWQRGGSLAWQVYDKSGRPTADRGRQANAIPVWGLPAVVAEKDGRFTIYH